MRKLTLSLDRLTVESFETLGVDGTGRGTVQAFVTTPRETCTIEWNPTYAPTCAATCQSCPGTCEYTCGGTCGFTCDATCAYTCDDPSCVSCLTYCAQLSCVEYCP
jgi:hypothetical protein